MTAAASKLYFATKILAIKCKENVREPPKSLSMAVLGDQYRLKCRILIYLNKNQHISVASIHPAFEFFICEDNDICYLDDAEDQWIIKFSDLKNFLEAFRQIFLCVFYARTPVDAWHLGKCYRRTQTAFRSPEIGDSVRVAYSLYKCDISGMKTCFSKEETIKIFQPSADQLDHFIIKYLLSMLCADHTLVIFESRRLAPLQGISKTTDIMGLDIRLIDIFDPTVDSRPDPNTKSTKGQSLIERMAFIGQSTFFIEPKKQPKLPQPTIMSPLFTDFVDSTDFEFNDPEIEIGSEIKESLPVQKMDLNENCSNKIALQDFMIESRNAYSDTKSSLAEIQKMIQIFVTQTQNIKVPQIQPERKSVQVQFSSDNKQRLVSIYRLAMSSQRKMVESSSSLLSKSIEKLSSKIDFFDTRLNFIANHHKSSAKTLIAKNRDLQTQKNSENLVSPKPDNFSIEQIKKILNYTYRSVKGDVVEAASAQGFDSAATEYFLQSLQKNIKSTLGKLHSGDH